MEDINYKEIKLNDEQRKAVEYIEGALLVLAGPGTGKTQLLSARVAEILKQTDTNPGSILCLTFTNKAALNMKERVLKLTDGKASGVVIKTFHSFAAEIMNMYPDYFWNGAKLSVAPSAVQTEILQDILSSLPLDNPLALKFYGQFTGISDVSKAIQLAKEAGLNPEKLKKIITKNLQYIDNIEPVLIEILSKTLSYKNLPDLVEQILEIPEQSIDHELEPLLPLSTKIRESLIHAVNLDKDTNKTKNTGEWKRKLLQTVNGQKAMFDERRRNNWWLNLADVYKKYRDQLHKRGYYDYSDMMVEVITQLENNAQLRADVQERFLYVMIDEFQDTNAAQLKLAHLVADHFAHEGNPNIMAVGDDDQSIFKFNGAELSNILHFKRAYPASKTIVLKENYRSHQAILDFSAKIMEQAESRLTKRDSLLDKNLIAKSDIKNSKIEHRKYKTADEQFYDIAKLIAKNYTDNKTIGVIARSHNSLIKIASILLDLGVPLNYEQQRNILDHPLIEQIYNLARICEAINSGDIDDSNVFISRTIKHPMWGLDSRTLWQIAVDNYRSPNWLEYLLDSKDENLKCIGNFLIHLAGKISQEKLIVAFEYLIGLRKLDLKDYEYTNPINNYYVKNPKTDLNEYLYGLSAIKLLRSLVTEYSAENHPTLLDFVNFVVSESNNGTIINDESPFVTGEHAVNLLSVHKAKGLEFDEVYIIDAVEDIWSPKSGGRKPPMNLPLQPILDDMDDYIRLMFVAVTRARSNLVISSYAFDQNGHETITSPIISPHVITSEITNPELNIQILENSLSWPRLTTTDEKSMLRSRLETYSLSVTSLLNFLDITSGGPAKFLERNLLRLPDIKTSSLSFGTAMHSALETAQKLTNINEFDLDQVKQSFKKALAKEHLPTNEQARYRDQGYKLIDRLFNEGFIDLQAGNLPEQDINDVHIGNARISGKLDRIDVADSQILISDYKTGKPLSSFSTKAESLQIKAWKQRTQLIFYALLLENSSRFDTKNKTISAQMIYLEADSPKEFIRQYTPSREEIDELSKLLQIVWQKIIILDLPDTSKYSPTYAGIQDFINDLSN